MKNQLTLPSIPFSSRAKLIVGVSGGSDSLGLLRLLLEKLPLASQRLVVAHVNYGLRGRDSHQDEEKVRSFCRQWGLAFKCFRPSDFKKKSKTKKMSVQDFARDIRYSFFLRLVQREKAWGVAVAHHQEDQAETILDRLLRGAGPRGLSGLRPLQTLNLGKNSTRLKIWRPLLFRSKEQIQFYLKSMGVPWREDRSNRGNEYRRNQIRNQIFPFLSQWNPKLTEVLARMGEVTSEEDRFLEELLHSTGKGLSDRWGRRLYSCPSKKFQKMPLALQRRWVRYVAEELTKTARGLSFDRIEEIIRLWDGKEVGPRDLGFGLVGGRNRNQAFLLLKGK
jgi:tRNA(Ile)-lysidine synthase